MAVNDKLGLNKNSGDNIPDEKKGNGSLADGKREIPSYIASEKGGAPRTNAYNKRDTPSGGNRTLRFKK
jgi:hypothetical protein